MTKIGQLEIGKEYRDRKGERVRIGGPTKENPEWVWSIQGNWYTGDGEFITTMRDGTRHTSPTHPRNIDITTGKEFK